MRNLEMTRISRNLLFLASLLLLGQGVALAASGCDGAGNCYIYASATGSGNGSSWTNAYTGFGSGSGQVNPGAMSRGVTYWIASGSYGGVTFSSPTSGATVITVEGATAASHGPDSTWNSNFAGQALFTESYVNTSYWTFNGQAGTGCIYPSNSTSCYSIKFWNQTDLTGAAINIAGTNLSFEYIEIEGTGMTGGSFPNNSTTSADDQDNGILNQGTGNDATDNLYVGYCYAHHTGNTQFQLNFNANNNATFEYNWVAYNHTAQNGVHDEAFSIYYSNLTIRYNVFQDICFAGIVTDAGGGSPALSNWAFYGNLVFWDSTYAAYNGKGGLATLDDGIICFFGESMSGYVYIYNNTIAGLYNSNMDAEGTGASTISVMGGSGVSSGNPTVIVENNLWYSDGYVYGGYAYYCGVVNCTSGSTDNYNEAIEGTVPANSNWQTNSPAAPNDVNKSGNANPFESSTASTVAGFELTSDTTAGISLGAPYNVDMTGVTRGANGVWDRGALQIGSSTSSSAPPAPGGLSVTAVQ